MRNIIGEKYANELEELNRHCPKGEGKCSSVKFVNRKLQIEKSKWERGEWKTVALKTSAWARFIDLVQCSGTAYPKSRNQFAYVGVAHTKVDHIFC